MDLLEQNPSNSEDKAHTSQQNIFASTYNQGKMVEIIPYRQALRARPLTWLAFALNPKSLDSLLQ